MNLKIHIVQKGDTMGEIAQQYGVDFEELKQLNNQISSPDMIMPGTMQADIYICKGNQKNRRIHND